MTKTVTINTAGLAVQAAVTTVLPEHRLVKAHTHDTLKPYCEFSGFIDEVLSDTIQSAIDIPTISIRQFTYVDGNTRIFYVLTAPPTDPLGDFMAACDALLKSATTDKASATFIPDYLGKKGKFNEIAKMMKDIAPEKRGQAGKILNELKQKLTNLSSERSNDQTIKQSSEFFDPTMPGIKPPLGHLHPISQAIAEITHIFETIGFTRVRYPEVDWDKYAFENLNMPLSHPAADEWETFFIDTPPHKTMGKMLLTPHTSNGQTREMERVKTPPIRMLNIGKCYRRQQDVTHTAMFHQFEGLVIDKDINIQHLKGVLDFFAKEFYGPTAKSRIRPFHFQFTEPSFEVDFSCVHCGGIGCRFCKSGWHEVGGAGMVHPNVLKAGGIDPTKYSGFAFGWGIERVYTLKPGLQLDDIRPLYANNLDFLSNF